MDREKVVVAMAFANAAAAVVAPNLLCVLTWEDAMRGAPWEYIEKCEETLTEYENR